MSFSLGNGTVVWKLRPWWRHIWNSLKGSGLLQVKVYFCSFRKEFLFWGLWDIEDVSAQKLSSFSIAQGKASCPLSKLPALWECLMLTGFSAAVVHNFASFPRLLPLVIQWLLDEKLKHSRVIKTRSKKQDMYYFWWPQKALGIVGAGAQGMWGKAEGAELVSVCWSPGSRPKGKK